MRRVFFGIAVVTALAASAPSARAQVIGPLMPDGRLELGVMSRWLDRAVGGSGASFNFTQNDGAIVFRYGATPSATVSGELSADPKRFGFDTAAIYYTVGGGIQTAVWSHEKMRVTTGVHYARTFARSRDADVPKYDEVEAEWTLHGEYPFAVGSGEATVWAGPVISYFDLTYHQSSKTATFDAEHVAGAGAGVDLRVLQHVVARGSFLWVGDLQSSVIVAWRF